jgi:iron complex outermembrane receptor protein
MATKLRPIPSALAGLLTASIILIPGVGAANEPVASEVGSGTSLVRYSEPEGAVSRRLGWMKRWFEPAKKEVTPNSLEQVKSLPMPSSQEQAAEDKGSPSASGSIARKDKIILAANEPAVTMPTLVIKEEKVAPLKFQSDKDRYRLPQTTESITRERMNETINMTGAEDAIKYMPSIQVRQRYIGDTNAPVGTRTSGMASSARTLIYADGVLISSLLGNNNQNTGSPRWQLIAPGEIERIDVMYGPFSAMYAGNSIGGVINITTKMPEKFEVRAEAQAAWQNFSQYATKDTYETQRYSGMIGHKYKDLSMRFDYQFLNTHSQPITFANPLLSRTDVAGHSWSAAPTPVTGEFMNANPTGANAVVLGAGNINHGQQNNFKWKLAYDFTPTIRGTYTLGMWENNATGSAQSYLRNSSGGIVDSGAVNIDGNRYSLNGTSATGPVFSANMVTQTTWSHSMNLRSNTGGKFDWELIGTLVDLSKDTVRAPTGTGQFTGNGAGRTTSLSGSGWHTVDARGIWRPETDLMGKHEVSFGFHHSQYTLKNPVDATLAWQTGAPRSDGTAVQNLYSNSQGKTQIEGYWVQDAWDFKKDWNFTFGGRFEKWSAYDGLNTSTIPAVTTAFYSDHTLDVTTAAGARLSTINQPQSDEFRFSPKGKLSWSVTDKTVLGAAIGQSYRFATASELFQTTTTGTGASAVTVNGNPNLKPEDAVSSEVSWQYALDKGRLRTSFFQERIKNAIYSQMGIVNGVATSFVNNVDQTDVNGFEAAADLNDFLGIRGFSISANGTWADARVTKNSASDAAAVAAQVTANAVADAACKTQVTSATDNTPKNDGYSCPTAVANVNAAAPSAGQRLARVPEFKANLVASYRVNDNWSSSANLRYSSAVFSQLNNSDTNGHTYVGNTAMTVVDLITNYKFNKYLTGTAGINNVNNERYWQFHMFPMRTYFVQARFSY